MKRLGSFLSQRFPVNVVNSDLYLWTAILLPRPSVPPQPPCTTHSALLFSHPHRPRAQHQLAVLWMNIFGGESLFFILKVFYFLCRKVKYNPWSTQPTYK